MRKGTGQRRQEERGQDCPLCGQRTKIQGRISSPSHIHTISQNTHLGWFGQFAPYLTVGVDPAGLQALQLPSLETKEPEDSHRDLSWLLDRGLLTQTVLQWHLTLCSRRWLGHSSRLCLPREEVTIYRGLKPGGLISYQGPIKPSDQENWVVMWVKQGRFEQGMYAEQENRMAWPYTYLYTGLWRNQMYGSSTWQNVCERDKKYVSLCNFITVKTQNNFKSLKQ